MSWADICFSTLVKIIDCRANDYEKFKSYVVGLENSLAYFHTDSLYASEIERIEWQRKHLLDNLMSDPIHSELGKNDIDTIYWDERFKVVSALVGRINSPAARFQEFLSGNSNMIKEISGKLAQGLGQNIIVTGKPGFGKSESGIVKFAQILSKVMGTPFVIKRQMTFSPEQFATIYNDVDNLPEGSSIAFDDAGVNYGNRDFFLDSNKLFSKLFQVIRYRALAVFISVPDLKLIDSACKPLLHWWFEVDHINRKQKLCYIKPHTVEVIQQTGDILYPYPIYDDRQLFMFRVDALDDESRREYQELARKFKDDVGKATEIQLRMNTTDPITLKYVQLRIKGNNQIKIRTELLPMSTTKASRLENEYKRYVASISN